MSRTVESNCIGYAFYKLGITDKEIPQYSSDIDLNKYFQTVDDPENACAIAVLTKREENYVLQHIALLDFKNRVVIHRQAYGCPVKHITYHEFRRDWDDPGFFIKFLQLKKSLIVKED